LPKPSSISLIKDSKESVKKLKKPPFLEAVSATAAAASVAAEGSTSARKRDVVRAAAM
jgi:tellurite resistance protein